MAESDADDADDDDDVDDVDIDETEEEDVGEGTTVGDAVAVAAAGLAAERWSRLTVIQECWRISSMEILSAGRSRRHRRIRSWHSCVSLVLNLRSALQICSSCSNGMSPQTMS
jgi:hypothetical protein